MLSTSRSASAHWWKFLAGGAILLTVLIGALVITGEVDEAIWLPMMITMLVGIAAVAAGLVLGITHLLAKSPKDVAS